MRKQAKNKKGFSLVEMVLAIYKSMHSGMPVSLPLSDFSSIDMKGTF